jgi:hypothetical protein
MFIGLTGQCSGIEGFQVAILVHVLSILGGKRGIKWTCNTATRAAFTGKIMNRNQVTRRLVSLFFFFFLMQKQHRFGLNKGVLTDFQFSPPSFKLFQWNP